MLFSRALRKRRTVGILKALGASAPSIFRMFFMEALFVSIGGAALEEGLQQRDMPPEDSYSERQAGEGAYVEQVQWRGDVKSF